MERQTLLLAAALFAGFDLAKAQNAPNASGLPSGALTGVLSYPTDFNQTPNVAPTTYNYTRQYTPLVPMTSIPSFDNTLGLPVLVHTTFQDGFGNPVLEIKRTNQQGDIVTPFYNRSCPTNAAPGL